MAQQHLYSPKVVAGFQQMGCKTVPESMHCFQCTLPISLCMVFQRGEPLSVKERFSKYYSHLPQFHTMSKVNLKPNNADIF